MTTTTWTRAAQHDTTWKQHAGYEALPLLRAWQRDCTIRWCKPGYDPNEEAFFMDEGRAEELAVKSALERNACTLV